RRDSSLATHFPYPTLFRSAHHRAGSTPPRSLGTDGLDVAPWVRSVDVGRPTHRGAVSSPRSTVRRERGSIGRSDRSKGASAVVDEAPDAAPGHFHQRDPRTDAAVGGDETARHLSSPEQP